MSDELITDAGIPGIGATTASRLEDVGISTVPELAGADASELSGRLAAGFPRLRPETLRQRVVEWIGSARELVDVNPERSERGHVFLLTLWVDADGRAVRSRFGHRSPEEPTSEETSIDSAGWSPAAFARFVARTAGLEDARELTEERPRPEVVEWAQYHLEGPLVRGRSAPVEIRADVSTDELGLAGTSVRWRAVGHLIPLGGGPRIALGTCAGTEPSGAVIPLQFGSHRIPGRLHRAWFDVWINPPPNDDAARPSVVGSERRTAG